jgi:hypothetical protein
VKTTNATKKATASANSSPAPLQAHRLTDDRERGMTCEAA